MTTTNPRCAWSRRSTCVRRASRSAARGSTCASASTAAARAAATQSPNRHASAHFRETGHPMIRSVAPDDAWRVVLRRRPPVSSPKPPQRKAEPRDRRRHPRPAWSRSPTSSPSARDAGGLEHREALIYTLGKAAELEHLIMLQYLFAAFSLKQGVDEGVSAGAARRDRALAQDAAGDRRAGDAPPRARPEPADGGRRRAPRLARPNFPMPAYSYPAGVRIELLPFGEAALRHFAFLERPEGMAVEDAEGFEAHRAGRRAAARRRSDEIVPQLQEFDTIGELYRSIQAGLEHLAEPARARSACSSGRRTPRRPRSTSAGRSSSR